MKFFIISAVLFLISLCVSLIGLFTTEYRYIVFGLVINYVGVAMLLVGAFKKYYRNK
ncbi:hypothetical protein ERJ70_16070 [Sediminibacillus dalangtanensis]|uniref:Uncharacterized protein n=1 Tax=Sediminibacillus dalangtanensis TaxID=2729421 RepID=A0ABX7VUN3_9BACI|nr:hypothetical protein [Sediminibacillus dalangtanensis]QTN00672.1 hypothetical protein ERJ70_16070 [Sediminibacillus dalangtanensis]